VICIFSLLSFWISALYENNLLIVVHQLRSGVLSEDTPAAARDEDAGAVFDEELCRSEAYSYGATSNDRRFLL
jgi:hypothetical protein